MMTRFRKVLLAYLILSLIATLSFVVLTPNKEIRFDDGTAEEFIDHPAFYGGWNAIVKFNVRRPTSLIQLKFFLNGNMTYKTIGTVYVYCPNANINFDKYWKKTPDLKSVSNSTKGWYVIDVTSDNIVVNDTFYVIWTCFVQTSLGLGCNTNQPTNNTMPDSGYPFNSYQDIWRMYNGYWWRYNGVTDRNYMIRVVVNDGPYNYLATIISLWIAVAGLIVSFTFFSVMSYRYDNECTNKYNRLINEVDRKIRKSVLNEGILPSHLDTELSKIDSLKPTPSSETFHIARALHNYLDEIENHGRISIRNFAKKEGVSERQLRNLISFLLRTKLLSGYFNQDNETFVTSAFLRGELSSYLLSKETDES